MRRRQLARALRGTSLGDDTLDAMSHPPPLPVTDELDDQGFKKQVLANQRELIEAHKHWSDGDKQQKWIAIAVTASIPVFSAIWRALGVGRRRKSR